MYSNIHICEIFEKYIDYPEKIILFDLTRMKSLVDYVFISAETLSKDSMRYFNKDFTKLIHKNH